MKTKKLFMIIIALVVMAVAGFVAQRVLFSTPKESNQIEQSAPSDWKILENDLYGSFKYPGDFISKVTPTPDYVAKFQELVKIGFALVPQAKLDSGRDYPQISVVVYEVREKTLKQFVEQDITSQAEAYGGDLDGNKKISKKKLDQGQYRAIVGDGKMGAYYIQQGELVYRVFWIGEASYTQIADTIRASLQFPK